MGYFTHAPFYLDKTSGMDDKQIRYCNSVLKSMYNEIQSKSKQKQEPLSSFKVQFTNMNGLVRQRYVTSSSSSITIYLELYLAKIRPGDSTILCQIDNIFDDYVFDYSGFADETLVYDAHDLFDIEINDDKQIILKRNSWEGPYFDYWDYTEGNIDYFCRLSINIHNRSSKEEEEDVADLSSNMNTLISTGESREKEHLNRAIKNIDLYIDSYKAEETKQDYAEAGDENTQVNETLKNMRVIGLYGPFVTVVGKVSETAKVVLDEKLKSTGLVDETIRYRFGNTTWYQYRYADDFDKELGTEDVVTTIELPHCTVQRTDNITNYMRYEAWYISGKNYQQETPFQRINKTTWRVVSGDIPVLSKFRTV